MMDGILVEIVFTAEGSAVPQLPLVAALLTLQSNAWRLTLDLLVNLQ
jgi:hypothetical protein